MPSNRRNFLAAGFAGATALVLPTSAADLPIKVGFLGATHSHALGKYSAVRSNPAFHLIGICETNAAARAKFASISPKYIDEPALLAESDLVVVESDVGALAARALAALNAGKHVHVEKPPSAKLADLEKMIQIARQKKLVFQTGYMWRFNPGVQKIFEVVRNGWLGQIYLVRATMNTLVKDKEARAQWGEFKGGAMFELGSHVVDFIVRLLGKPHEVHGFLRNHGAEDGLKDNNLAILEYPKTLALITNNTLQPNPFAHRQIEVCGTNGTALLKPIEPPTLEIDLAQPAGSYQAGKNRLPVQAYERYHGDFAELARLIQGTASPVATFEQELAVHQTLLRICGMN